MDDTKFAINNYDGVTVFCTNSQWDNHIVANHAIMEKNVMAVKDTIKDPDTVYKSSQNEGREIYFKDSPLSTYNMKTKVIVEYMQGVKNPENTVGEVITAFPQPKEKGGISDVVYKRTTES